MSSSVALQRGLPCDLPSERFLLGSILLNSARLPEIAAQLRMDDFSTEAHRRIWARMISMVERGDAFDHSTLATELHRFNELSSVGGVSYLIDLDEHIPIIADVSGYVRSIQEKSRLRQIAVISQNLMDRALVAEETSTDILVGAESLLMGLAQRRSERGLVGAMEIIEETEGGINAFLDPSKRQQGLATGFTRFDAMTGGLRAGELIILAARPAAGKSAMALNIAWHISTRLFQPVAFFSLEMSRQSLLTRAICGAARVDSQRFRSGYLNAGERQKLRQAAQQATETPLYIDDTAGTTLMDVRSKVTQLVRKIGRPIGLVVVDYLQLMSSKGKKENRTQEVSELSRGLKLLSKEMACPVLALSQLSRAVETRAGDHRPQLSDLRDAGSIEQDADIVAFIFRECLYKRDREDLHGVAELILAKSRNGPIGRIDLVFLDSVTKFENRAEDLGEPAERLPYADD